MQSMRMSCSLFVLRTNETSPYQTASPPLFRHKGRSPFRLDGRASDPNRRILRLPAARMASCRKKARRTADSPPGVKQPFPSSHATADLTEGRRPSIRTQFPIRHRRRRCRISPFPAPFRRRSARRYAKNDWRQKSSCLRRSLRGATVP